MANYGSLLTDINNKITTNGRQEITGQILNGVLTDMVGDLGKGYQFMGVATPSGSPASTDAPIFYIAGTAGTYSSFGGLVVADGEVAVLKHDLNGWSKAVTGAASSAELSDLGQEMADLYGEYANNPEYIRAYTDADGRFLWGIKTDGSIEWAKGIPTPIAEAFAFVNANKVDKEEGKELSPTEIVNAIYFDSNPEWVAVWTDNSNSVLFGIKKDGSVEWSKGVPRVVQDYLSTYYMPFSDEEKEILSAIMASIYPYIDVEGRLEMTLDADERIISYRKADGTLVENVGLEPKRLTLPDSAANDLAEALERIGWTTKSPIDWSDKQAVNIPLPRTCAIINLGVDSQATTKTADIETTLEYWDMDGNYFKKPIILNAQGDTSLTYHIKNQGFDLDDGSTLKFGSWIPCDSFHIKKYFIDVFRGQCVVGYRLVEQAYRNRPFGERYPWDYLYNSATESSGTGEFKADFPSGAMAHPDGFPIHLFFNGSDAGVYAFCLKKDRANYMCKKNTQTNLILDGILGAEFWEANGTMGSLWEDFEVRNPKISTDIDGNPYDGDNPKEPADTYATAKNAIVRLTTALSSVAAENTIEAKKTKFEEFFNVPFLIDYDILANVLYHHDGYRKNWIWLSNDGVIWSPTMYDLDSIFGQYWNGASYVSNSTTNILGTSSSLPSGILKQLYKTDMDARYKELRDADIISVKNIMKLLTDWVEGIGYDNLKTDIEDICTSPYIENGVVVTDSDGNPILVPNTPSYRDSELQYQYPPTDGGWYNSVLRVRKWLEVRIANLDVYFNY